MQHFSFDKYLGVKSPEKNYILNNSRVQKDYDLYFFYQYLNHRNQFEIFPSFPENNSYKLIMNGNNLPLVIIFQGFFQQYIDTYYSTDPELQNLELLHQSELKFSFGSFVKQNKNYNYLLLKDNYQSWYMMHFDMYLKVLIETIKKTAPSRVYTLGSSAGGFAALLFGHYLRVDKAVAYSPQTLAFYHFMTSYRQKLNNRYFMSNLSFNDLGLIQRINQGFACNIDISIAKYNKADMEELGLLSLNDKNMTVNYIETAEHNVFSFLDKRNEFNRLLKIFTAI